MASRHLECAHTRRHLLTMDASQNIPAKNQAKAAKNANAAKLSLGTLPPPNFSRVMLIMLWKNLTIKKRRKLEQLLMLFQIMIWFGFGASRFLFRGKYQFMPAVAPTRPGATIPFFKHMSLPANHPIGLSLAEDPNWTFPQVNFPQESLAIEAVQGHPSIDGEYLARTLDYMKASLSRTLGSMEVVLHANNGTAAAAMREDVRSGFHIHVERLLPSDNNVSIALTFWDREVPLGAKISGHADVCRVRENKLTGGLSSLLPHSDHSCEAGKYFTSSFLLAQSSLLNAILRAKLDISPAHNTAFLPDDIIRTPLHGRLEFPGVSVVAEDFPLHSGLHSFFPDLAGGTPMFIMFAFSRFMMSALQDLVSEKESKLKEVMKIFGLSTSHHWVSWLATAAGMNVLYTCTTIVIAKLCNMFPNCSYFALAVFFYFYMLSLLTSGMLISVFFEKVQTVNIVGHMVNVTLHGIGWLLTLIPSYPWHLRILLCLMSPIAFSLGLDETIRGLPMRTLTLGNWFDPTVNHMGLYTIMLIFDALSYFLLAWYLDSVMASSFGTAKPWYFPVTDLYTWILRLTGWFNFEERRPSMMLTQGEETHGDSGNMEAVSPLVASHGCAVHIRNLVKEFTVHGERKRAVDGLSLDIYKSEIFALLGHNGAGKTTTISILTGMLASDEGEAWINGYNIKKNPRQVQQSISVCPQHNIFIDELLCIEHLCFFAGLRGVDIQTPLLKLQNPQKFAEQTMKDFQQRQLQEQLSATQGISVKEARSETKTWDGVIEMVYRFGLTGKLFQHPRALSGGQKRRLWLAMALIAEPSVVFLDEPTSGVDPVGRQEIWKVIQEERRSGRCIVLTTHHMEEADILADRKAVMAQGRLRCLGTSLFLKSKFGIGYYLEIQLEREIPNLEDARIQVSKMVTARVPEAKRIDAGDTMGTMAALSASFGMLLFALPLSEVSKFGPLLSDLEKTKKELRIREYAMSMSTLEEVFFKLGEDVGDSGPQEELPHLNRALSSGELEVGAPNLTALGTHGRSRSSSVLEADVVAAQQAAEPVSNTASNLLEQKFPEVGRSGKWQQFSGITYLRYAQIFHNKMYFFVDILLPMVLFFGGLFIRSESPGNVDALFSKTTVEHSFADFNKYLNNSIPYMVDPALSPLGLQKVADLLSNFPFKNLMLPIMDSMEPSALKEATSESLFESLRESSRLSEQYLDQIYLEPEPTSSRAYMMRRPKMVKKFINQRVLLSEDLPFVFNVQDPMRRTNPEGLFLRNFVWTTTSADMFGTWSNFYPAAIYFEPASKTLSDTNALAFLEHDYDNVQIRYMWNPYAVHALPTFMNGLGNSLYASLFPEEGTPNISIRSAPIYEDLPVFITSLTWVLYSILSLVMSSLPQKFGGQVMFDRALKTKHSLIVMGCPFVIYWIGTFISNWCVMMLANTGISAAIAWFLPIFSQHPASLFVSYLAMLAYSAAMLAYGYFWTFVFQAGRSYNMFMNLSIVLLALVPAYLVSICHDATLQIAGIPLPQISRILHRLSCFTIAPYIPMGCMIACVIVINRAHAEKRIATLDEFLDPAQGVIWTVIGALTQTLVYGSLIVYLDSKQYTAKRPDRHAVQVLKQWKDARATIRQRIYDQGGDESMVPVQFQTTKDDDVRYEEQHVADIMTVLKSQEEAQRQGAEIPVYFPNLNHRPPKILPPIVIHNLHHVYLPTSSAGEPTVAVKGLCLSVTGGEVLGLLGPNGAGKSTTINLLTCDSMLDAPSEGDGYLGGISVTALPQRAFPFIGLVPQFDALWPDVTVADNLHVFANIKRISKGARPIVIDKLLTSIGLTPHLRKRISELSGGNKRRTSVAVAFLGNPRVILMDEPSSGIDPGGRRKLLEMIQKECKGRAIIITTHSMEEAESLCTRVGIVVNGELQCLNTCMAIKNNYGSGIRLELELAADWKQTGRLNVNDRKRIIDFVNSSLAQGAQLVEEVASRLFFMLPVTAADLGRLFTTLNENASRLGIKDYALSQPTLDQVFIKFARKQGATTAARE